MPFVRKIETEAGILGIWELLETADELEKVFTFSELEKIDYRQLKFERRKTEFLSTRLLTEILAGKKVEIEYLPSGKPRLKNESLFISISHSENLVAILISGKYRVGIDVERIDRKIDHATKRYLSIEEVRDIQNLKNQQIGKITYWCAKESIFKCTPNEGILFKSHISITPFLINEEGTFYGILNSNTWIENFKLSYFNYKNNMVVYCVPL